MKLLPLIAPVTLVLASQLNAQTEIVFGSIEQGVVMHQFFLAHTNIPVTSQTVDLGSLVGKSFMFKVTNLGVPTKPVLDVLSALPANPKLVMADLLFDQFSVWTVYTPPGAFAGVALDLEANTGFLPFPGMMGTWLLGPKAGVVATGVADQYGRYDVKFFVPKLPALIGLEVTGQAVIVDGGTVVLTEVDGAKVGVPSPP